MVMRVKDVMTRQVISIAADQTLLDAARLMLDNRISGLPVVGSDGRLVGIVTEGDFLRRGEIGTQRQRPKWLEFLVGPGQLASEYVRASGRKVDQVMTTAPHTASEDDSLEAVVDLMERRHVKRLPVVHDGRIVGIVSRADLMRALANLARNGAAARTDDSAIRDRILAAYASASWAPRIKVKVHDGVVDLSGIITDERERKGLIVAAENIPGVKEVHDHVAWVEPMSGQAFPSPEDDAALRAKAQRPTISG